jgi:hypothetical protein
MRFKEGLNPLGLLNPEDGRAVILRNVITRRYTLEDLSLHFRRFRDVFVLRLSTKFWRRNMNLYCNSFPVVQFVHHYATTV